MRLQAWIGDGHILHSKRTISIPVLSSIFVILSQFIISIFNRIENVRIYRPLHISLPDQISSED